MLIGFSLYLYAAIFLFQGPATYTGLKPSIVQNVVVRALNGIASAGVYIVCLPYFMEVLSEILPNE